MKQLDIFSKHQSSFFLELVSGLSLWAVSSWSLSVAWASFTAKIDTLGHPNNYPKHHCNSISWQIAIAWNIQQLSGYTSISLACDNILVVPNVVTDVSPASKLFLSRSSVCSSRKARSCSDSSSSKHSSMSQKTLFDVTVSIFSITTLTKHVFEWHIPS